MYIFYSIFFDASQHTDIDLMKPPYETKDNKPDKTFAEKEVLCLLGKYTRFHPEIGLFLMFVLDSKY